MKKLIYFFYPKIKVSYFDKLKTLFFINLSFFLIVLLTSFLISDFWFSNENFLMAVYSKLGAIIFLFIALFILRVKGIKFAGNLFSLVNVVILLIAINIIPKEIDPIYKYLQGFYSILVYLVIGLLFATRPIILISSSLTLITTTHVYFYSIAHYPNNSTLFTAAFIYHTIVLLGITVIIFFANKFTDLAVDKANKEFEQRGLKFQELLATEEEIRAANEELVATTDALVDSNKELTRAKEKAEESIRLKTEFLNNISHEVRTPLNGILGFSQLLGISDLEKQNKNEYIEIIQKSGNQLIAIIDDIIEISKLGTGQVPLFERQINLNEMVSDLYTIFNVTAKEKNLSLLLKKEFTDIQSYIIIDEIKVYKILRNLLENAIKFTEKGSIEFGYRIVNVEKSRKILETRHALSLQFYVKDTGIGIEPEKQERIFDKFSQAESILSHQYSGLGLGLSIAKENAKLMGGTIGLISERGKGSTFTLTIPYKHLQI